MTNYKERKEYYKDWRDNNKDKIRLYTEKGKEKKRLYDIEYRNKNKDRICEYKKQYLKNLRKSTVEALGGECVRCSFDDLRALQFDHIDGNGNADRVYRKIIGIKLYKEVLEDFINGGNKYQLLCANCNWIKREENRELYK